MNEEITQGQVTPITKKKAQKPSRSDKEARVKSLIHAMEEIVLSEKATFHEKAEACNALCLYRGLHYWDF